jgi:hypothetical protein
MCGAKSGGKLDTTPWAWANLWEKLGIDFYEPRTMSRLANLDRRQKVNWTIFLPHSVTTQQLVEISKAVCSFRRFEDAFVYESLPDVKSGVDIILSHRPRPKSPEGFSVICARGLDEASQDRSFRGYSAHNVWEAISGEWFLSLRDYLALWLLAKDQNKKLDFRGRTLCAGSRVLRELDLPPWMRKNDHRETLVPAVGVDHGILRIERVPGNLRRIDCAPRRIYDIISLYSEKRSSPVPEFKLAKQPKLATLM